MYLLVGYREPSPRYLPRLSPYVKFFYACLVAQYLIWDLRLCLCIFIQLCKNIVLAGVGSVTLVDGRPVTEEALNANFLVPPDEKDYAGRSIAEVCCDSLKDFNPMVRVTVEKGLGI